MVARLLRLAAPPEPPDAADALALALCHAVAAPLRQRRGRGDVRRPPGSSARSAARSRERSAS